MKVNVWRSNTSLKTMEFNRKPCYPHQTLEGNWKNCYPVLLTSWKKVFRSCSSWLTRIQSHQTKEPAFIKMLLLVNGCWAPGDSSCNNSACSKFCSLFIFGCEGRRDSWNTLLPSLNSQRVFTEWTEWTGRSVSLGQHKSRLTGSLGAPLVFTYYK